MISKYTQNFWSVFSSWKDFNDIGFLGWIYNTSSYYYCVAYVGDNVYMRWYPQATSPVCGGQFCGTKNTTTAEFIQVVINILAKYIYKDITLNRREVNKRLTSLKANSYEAKNFTTDNKKTIAERSTTCENTCALQDKNDILLYLKYCMFNINKCNMQEIGKIKKWYWPIAELNLLYDQNIIDIDKTTRNNTAKDIDGKTVIETLFKLNSKIDCTFNNDYDCDGVNNAKDSCTNTYNPKQKDFDKDGIGDVCDDDIDNDGIKNPIGIIDDEGKIDISKLKWINTNVWWKNIWTAIATYMDNCLFTVNTTQDDNNNNSIGDACETSDNQMGIYIHIDKLVGSAPITTTFTAMTSWQVEWISWDFGDGTQWVGNPITHTFIDPGMYNIQSIAQGKNMQVKAQTIVIVGKQATDDTALQTRASNIGWKSSIETLLSISSIGTFDEIDRIFPKEWITYKKKPHEDIKKTFNQPGQHPVIVKWYRNGELAGVNYFTIGIWETAKGSILRSNNNNPEIYETILLDTKTYNIKQDDIVDVLRDFGDTIKKSTTTLTIEHAYTTPGKKIITQTITLTDNTKLMNAITINSIDKTLFSSYALVMIPSKLISNIGEKIYFETNIVWTLLNTPIIQILEFSDWTSNKKAGTEKLPSNFSHNYQNNRVLTPQDNIFINKCAYLRNQATISIQGTDMCLDAALKWTLNRIYTCDMDKDNIPDICDADIDWDGISNLIGTINVENKDCSIHNEDNDWNNNWNNNW